MTGAVVVDTNVFTARLRRDSDIAARNVKHLARQLITVAPQTVAEARYGALKSGWGPRRITELAAMTADVTVLPVDAETIEQVAQLRNAGREAGHALHQSVHNADRWIGAAALRWDIPLVAHDAVFVGCPGLDLRTEVFACCASLTSTPAAGELAHCGDPTVTAGAVPCRPLLREHGARAPTPPRCCQVAGTTRCQEHDW